MSVIAGVLKGLGVGLLCIGGLAAVAGLILGFMGLGELDDCAGRENSFNRCSDEQAEIAEVKMGAGFASAGAGAVALGIGSLLFFTGRGVQERANRAVARQESPLPSIEKSDEP